MAYSIPFRTVFGKRKNAGIRTAIMAYALYFLDTAEDSL